MKKILLTLLIIYPLSLITALNASAVSPAPTASSSAQQILNVLQDYLSKHPITEKRGILGKVTDVSDTKISLIDINGNTRFVNVDELTKFIPLSSSTTSFGISDIQKGDTLGILGLYNKQSREILARAIYQEDISRMIHGNIANIDSDNFVLTVATDDKNQFDVSVENTTRTLTYDSSSQNLLRSGFSKLKQGEKIFIRGSLDPKNDKLILGDAIVVFPDIIKGGAKPEISPTAIPSTGSGKKLTPIVR